MADAAILTMSGQARAFEGRCTKDMMAPLRKSLGTMLAVLAIHASLASQQ
jgi:hypothetical protein